VSKPQAERQEFVLASTMDSVRLAEAAAEKLAVQAGFDKEQCDNIAIAVREAALNAVHHGNEYNSEKRISVCLEKTGTRLIFTITDQGCGFDPDALPDPLAPENLLRVCGRGVFLIRTFMDELHFRDLHPGTELTLVKMLPTASDAPDLLG